MTQNELGHFTYVLIHVGFSCSLLSLQCLWAQEPWALVHLWWLQSVPFLFFLSFPLGQSSSKSIEFIDIVKESVSAFFGVLLHLVPDFTIFYCNYRTSCLLLTLDQIRSSFYSFLRWDFKLLISDFFLSFLK